MSQPYPFDPTGTYSSNRITNELAIITIANGINAFLIRPDAAPFYGSSLVIINSNGIALEENVDYFLSHHWALASENIGLEVYGTVTLLNHTPSGNYRLNYQTIGGEYVLAPQNAIQSGLAASATSYVTVDWSTAPVAFPSIPHHQELDSFSGITQIYQALHKIADAVRTPTQGVHYDDLIGADIANVVSNVEPTITLIETVATLHNDQAKLILGLKGTIDQLNISNSIPNNLKYYTIPLFGDFKLKVGQVTFDYASPPTMLTFVKPAFTTQCLFAQASISKSTANGAVVEDKVYIGKPLKTGMRVKVVYDALAPATGTRTIFYFAIGI